MELLNYITTLIAIVIGWGLNEASKIWTGKRQDKKKLKKLLFYLLELRYYLSVEDNHEFKIKQFVSRYIDKVKVKYDVQDEEINMDQVMHFLSYMLTDRLEHSNQFELLEQNIDTVIEDLSEILPVMAYELNGQHRIKERLSNADNYFENMKIHLGSQPFDFKEWLMPKINDELLDDLEESILRIAKKIGRKTRNQAEQKLFMLNETQDEIMEDLDEFINEYLEKVKLSM